MMQMNRTAPALLASAGKPTDQYQHAQYKMPQKTKYGSSETMRPVVKATQLYMRDLLSAFMLAMAELMQRFICDLPRASKISRRSRNIGCSWLITPGATKMKLNTEKRASWSSPTVLPGFQKAKPVFRVRVIQIQIIGRE